MIFLCDLVEDFVWWDFIVNVFVWDLIECCFFDLFDGLVDLWVSVVWVVGVLLECFCEDGL